MRLAGGGGGGGDVGYGFVRCHRHYPFRIDYLDNVPHKNDVFWHRTYTEQNVCLF